MACLMGANVTYDFALVHVLVDVHLEKVFKLG